MSAGKKAARTGTFTFRTTSWGANTLKKMLEKKHMDKSHIWYWVIMAVLIVGCIALLYFAMINAKKARQEEAEMSKRRGRARKKRSETADQENEAQRKTRQSSSTQKKSSEQKPSKKKRLWKLTLQDLDSDRKYSIIFYDNIGIGRVREGSRFEKFIVLSKDERISKLHCSIFHEEDRLYIQDEGSRNGTFLNGKRIMDPVMIQRDDVIGVGETHLEVVSVQRESK